MNNLALAGQTPTTTDRKMRCSVFYGAFGMQPKRFIMLDSIMVGTLDF